MNDKVQSCMIELLHFLNGDIFQGTESSAGSYFSNKYPKSVIDEAAINLINSVFPINIKPHETVEVLMEFEPTFIELNNEEKQKLILITSKKKVSKVISKLESKTTPSQLAKLTSKVRKEPF